MADSKFHPADVEQVWYRDSDVSGPTALILGGVHGNELAGIEVVKRMVSGAFDLPLDCGKVIVALGNIAAIKANVRSTDKNLNRQFRNLSPDELEDELAEPSYEVGRARELTPLLDEADSALDLHSFRSKDGQPFIITEQLGFSAAHAIGAAYISSGWSTAEAGGTDGYMHNNGKVGICYESSQLEDLKHGVPRAEAGVLRFLGHMELIEPVGQPAHPHPRYIHAEQSVLANAGFAWGADFPYKSFQSLEPGSLIAQNGFGAEHAIYARPSQVIIFPSSETIPMLGAEMFTIGTDLDLNRL